MNSDTPTPEEIAVFLEELADEGQEAIDEWIEETNVES